MGPRYGIALFYGFYLLKEDILKLTRQFPEFQPNQEEGNVRFPGMDWFQEVYDDYWSFIDDINKRLEGPVHIETLSSWNKDSSEGLWGAETMLVANLFHSVDGTEFIVPDLINFNQDKEIQLLQEACLRYNIEWRTPAFHLVFDPYYGYWKEAAYEGILFYGILIDDNRKQFVKKILEIDWSYFASWGTFDELCERLWEKVLPEKFREQREKMKPLWDALEKKRETLLKDALPEEFQELRRKMDDEEERLWKTYSLWLESVFNSPEYQKWELDDEICCYLFDGNGRVFKDLDATWKGNSIDSVCIGSFATNDKWVWYLGIRSTRVSAWESNGAFRLDMPDLPRWDSLLQEKCALYGIEFKGAHYYILRNDII
jgi:hypothetical protein